MPVPPVPSEPTLSWLPQIGPALITAVVSVIGLVVTYKNAANALNNATALAEKNFLRTQRKEIQTTLASIAKHLHSGGAANDPAFQAHLIDAQYALPFFGPDAEPTLRLVLDLQARNASREMIASFVAVSTAFLNHIAKENLNVRSSGT